MLYRYMSLEKHQKEVDEWVSNFTPKYWPPMEQFARLVEEVGELGRELNHMHGSKKKKSSEEVKELGQELSDVLFTLICLANNHNISLEEEWEKLVNEKMYGRDLNSFEKKESSNEGNEESKNEQESITEEQESNDLEELEEL